MWLARGVAISVLLGAVAVAQELVPPKTEVPPAQAIAPATVVPPAAEPKPAETKPAEGDVPSPKVAAMGARSYELEIPADKAWTDTSIALAPGDKVEIEASGNIQYLGATAGPDGLVRSFKDLLSVLPVDGAGRGALIGRISDRDTAVPFAIGASKTVTDATAGHLFLGINQPSRGLGGSSGAYHVKVRITPAVASAGSTTASVPKFKAELLEQVPRRIQDQQGNPGDMVNFLVVGSEGELQQAFTAGGWVSVDRTKAQGALHAALDTLSHKSYIEMPMSELYLYNRPQDFGFARADPLAVVATRHHLRIWRAPFDFGGQPVWVGAATHDMGFEKDQRNGGVTHHIDPNVDAERDFVLGSLQDGGHVAGSDFATPKDPLTEARTATGGSFHSDGRVLILVLR